MRLIVSRRQRKYKLKEGLKEEFTSNFYLENTSSFLVNAKSPLISESVMAAGSLLTQAAYM